MKRFYLLNISFSLFYRKKRPDLELFTWWYRTELVLWNRANHPSDFTRDQFDWD